MNHQQLLKHAKRIAEQAGDLVMQYYRTGTEVEKKADDSPVTAADIAADKHIREELAELTDYTIITEESSQQDQETRRMWVVDPIDGTRGFINENDHFAIHIALLEDGKPVLGVVHAPALNKTYTARSGHGARLNDNPIHTNNTTESAEATLVITTSPRPEEFFNHLETLPHREVVRHGSYGLRLGLIAEGRADALIDPKAVPKSWDVAAPAVVLAEAGGRVTTTDGKPVRFSLADAYEPRAYLSTNGALHEDYLEALKQQA